MGYENDLLFSIPEDLKRFKAITMGHPVIMGRRTWESIPDKFRPLPGRTNIIITSSNISVPIGVIKSESVEEGMNKALEIDEEIFFIGGAGVFKEAIKFADKLLLTEIEGDKQSDTFFPSFAEDFVEIKKEGPFETKEGIRYWFTDYKKK